MHGAPETMKPESVSRATRADFCRTFEKNMNHLYLLSFLLTADRSLAEECFVRGLEDSTKSNRVFKEWVDSWARRTIIHNAIQMIRPRPTDGGRPGPESDRRQVQATTERPEINAVVRLAAFDRFVFVMSVLEHQSDQESALLLGCTCEQVTAGQARALQQIERLAKLRQEPVAGISGDKALHDDCAPAFPLETVSPLTVSA